MPDTRTVPPRKSFSKRGLETIAMLLVVHGEGPLHFELSVDGRGNGQNVPRSQVTVKARSGSFILAQLLGMHATEFKLYQTNVPLLCKSVAWTEEQIKQWRDMRPELFALRKTLRESRRRRAQRTPFVRRSA